MSRFKGKNDNKKLINKVWNRASYHSQAYKDTGIVKSGEHISIVNFNFSEMRYYGKIDDEADPVVVDTTRMARLGGTAQSHEQVNLMLPPIKDMFDRFQRKFAQAVRLQKIRDDDPFLASPVPHNTFVDPIREYRIYASNIMDVFNNEYLLDPQIIKQITTMDDYIKHLMDYLTFMGSDFPITLTGWRKSRQSSLLSTGMALSIANLDCSVDKDKEEFILNKNCTQFYYQTCKQYGFSISKQCPWVIVLDVASAGSREHLGRHGVATTRGFFQNYYKKTYTLDIELLRPLIRKSFADFVRVNRLHKEIEVCRNNHNKLVYKNIFRNPINKREYNNNYDLYYWIPQYIKIRNMEDEFPYDEPSLVRITQKASEFEKLLDKDKAMGYINEQFRKKYKHAAGTFVYYKRRLDERRKQSD